MPKFKIPVSISELRLDFTLQCGQSFRWFEVEPKKWRGVIKRQVWTLNQDERYLYCDVFVNKKENKDNLTVLDFENIIKNYLRLDVVLEDLYKTWSEKDEHFAMLSKDYPGIRMLNQDEVENVFSFICSSNNNIERITKLVNLLCSELGPRIACINGENFYAFPTVKTLAGIGVEAKLYKLSFGYRAKYIHASAKMIMEKGGEDWLRELKSLDYRSCHHQISSLSGIGPKVADCVCLMSMNHLDAIPVDTHVFQIAARDYLTHLRQKKSLTAKIYEEIGDYFRNVFGPYAGWAHSVLFTADLRKFKNKGKKRSHDDST